MSSGHKRIGRWGMTKRDDAQGHPYWVKRTLPENCKHEIVDGYHLRWIEDNATGCHVWYGTKVKGYGWVAKEGAAHALAHRVTYMAKIGPIPAGHQIDHLCRNRACINPEHLEAVTQCENIRRGVRVRLDMETVRAIRNAHKAGATATELAEKYEYDTSGMSKILKGKLWKE